MFERLPSRWMLALKKVGYWIWLIPVLGIPLSYYWSQGSAHADAWPWLVISVVFGVIPLLDFIVGRDPANPDECDEVPALEAQGYYRLLSLATVPLLLAMLVWSGWIFASYEGWSWVGQLGWVLSVGTVMGAIGITVSHELIHKDPTLEQNAGGLLLAAVCYAGFKVEHVRGHHVHVSTPEDASSSRFGQSLYAFLPHAYKHNFLNAWKLEAERLKRRSLPALHWRNELIWWYAISALFLLGFTLALGPLGALFFLGQAVIAFTLLEIVNYVEHYGLHRRKLDSGRYERTNAHHSWNSNFLLTNLFLFHLQRHSDHHAYAKRRYQVLRHFDDSPQLPNGYAGMIVLAVFPPLWRAVMDPKVRAYYAGEEHQLSESQPT
ncbi:alkane 1-monooxygenase [Pseudomonas sp. MDMC216]|jgi:alkane 1-monooxygenase|uniref:Alkane 1-monooxygenase n=1 Tax=Ectopseudomonas chengduensis TaxID=489632 RepID=A0A1G6NQP6_9GAMM|nr:MULTISPECIES: alkane 1-monooxygenase [Pseudomonas]KJU78386.1 alkane 1-monooxygenase [Pseudomonas oleovorans]KJU78389.1 alkane 1-monooxygenase [Pseudomonas oleovorans]KQO31087.1 alkane 1-monooxygenase [Pseudomonas sp. Leaf83]MBP3061811.1 alkane 1-monooxygenase [Pseudomonas chengduensis]MDH0957737.1 alkane 1-monooxygenase [Pseudomonas chengduensis]